MSPLERLLSELRKRPVWQVAGVYLAGSWVVLQVMDVLAQNLTLPSAAFPSALILLAVGLPIVVVTSLLQRGVDSGIPAAKGLRRVFTWRMP